MSDIMSILQNSYASSSLTTPSSTPYTNVDPANYQGNWNGTYSNNQNSNSPFQPSMDFARRSNTRAARPFSTRAS